MRCDRSMRFSASASGKPRSLNTFPLPRSAFSRPLICVLSFAAQPTPDIATLPIECRASLSAEFSSQTHGARKQPPRTSPRTRRETLHPFGSEFLGRRARHSASASNSTAPYLSAPREVRSRSADAPPQETSGRSVGYRQAILRIYHAALSSYFISVLIYAASPNRYEPTRSE